MRAYERTKQNAERQFIVIIFSTDITTEEHIRKFMKEIKKKCMDVELLMCEFRAHRGGVRVIEIREQHGRAQI